MIQNESEFESEHLDFVSYETGWFSPEETMADRFAQLLSDYEDVILPLLPIRITFDNTLLQSYSEVMEESIQETFDSMGVS